MFLHQTEGVAEMALDQLSRLHSLTRSEMDCVRKAGRSRDQLADVRGQGTQ